MAGCQYVRSLAVEVARSEAIDAADATRTEAGWIRLNALWSTLVVPGLTRIDTLSRVASGHQADLELRSSAVGVCARIALKSGAHKAVRLSLGGEP
jgi:hypothetical protein